jgi:hypothetical protein
LPEPDGIAVDLGDDGDLEVHHRLMGMDQAHEGRPLTGRIHQPIDVLRLPVAWRGRRADELAVLGAREDDYPNVVGVAEFVEEQAEVPVDVHRDLLGQRDPQRHDADREDWSVAFDDERIEVSHGQPLR